jgi:ATP-dependent Clp protease ATP-binding subunit ClpC
MFERYTGQSRRILWAAYQESQWLNHDYVGTEHILLGLLSEELPAIFNLFQAAFQDVAKLRLQIEESCSPGSDTHVPARPPLTPRARKCLEHAAQQAAAFRQTYVAPEHLLLGLMMEAESNAVAILQNAGLNVEDLRELTRNLPASENRDHMVLSGGSKNLGKVLDPSVAELEKLFAEGLIARF